MFKSAGLRFAVENAVPELKATADRVVSSNDQNGVAEAIQYILANSERRSFNRVIWYLKKSQILIACS